MANLSFLKKNTLYERKNKSEKQTQLTLTKQKPK